MAQDVCYVQIYIIYLNLVVHGIVPLLLLLVLNFMVYRQLRSAHTIYSRRRMAQQGRQRSSLLFWGRDCLSIECRTRDLAPG